MENIIINYHRLQRHYNLCTDQYDEIALLDLAHTLRVWMDMKDEVNQYIQNSDSLREFRYHSISKAFRDLSKQTPEYFITGFPGGVMSYATNSEVVSSNNSLIKGKAFILQGMKPTEKGIILYFMFVLNGANPSEREREMASKAFIENKISFLEWLNSEAVRVKYLDADGNTIRTSLSKEDMVRRVANYLGPSHPRGKDNFPNEKNRAIEFLQESFIGGLPASYFILLKIAKDILDNISLESKYPRKE